MRVLGGWTWTKIGCNKCNSDGAFSSGNCYYHCVRFFSPMWGAELPFLSISSLSFCERFSLSNYFFTASYLCFCSIQCFSRYFFVASIRFFSIVTVKNVFVEFPIKWCKLNALNTSHSLFIYTCVYHFEHTKSKKKIYIKKLNKRHSLKWKLIICKSWRAAECWRLFKLGLAHDHWTVFLFAHFHRRYSFLLHFNWQILNLITRIYLHKRCHLTTCGCTLYIANQALPTSAIRSRVKAFSQLDQLSWALKVTAKNQFTHGWNYCYSPCNSFQFNSYREKISLNDLYIGKYIQITARKKNITAVSWNNAKSKKAKKKCRYQIENQF